MRKDQVSPGARESAQIASDRARLRARFESAIQDARAASAAAKHSRDGGSLPIRLQVLRRQTAAVVAIPTLEEHPTTQETQTMEASPDGRRGSATTRLTTEIHEGAVTVLVLRGEADTATLGQLCAALEAAAESCPDKPVVADLRDVTLLDGAGLQVLVDTHKQLARGGCRLLVLSARGTQPDRALLLGGLDRILSLIHSLDEIDAISGGADGPNDAGRRPA